MSLNSTDLDLVMTYFTRSNIHQLVNHRNITEQVNILVSWVVFLQLFTLLNNSSAVLNFLFKLYKLMDFNKILIHCNKIFGISLPKGSPHLILYEHFPDLVSSVRKALASKLRGLGIKSWSDTDTVGGTVTIIIIRDALLGWKLAYG